MSVHEVIFTPEALEQLQEIEHYIAEASGHAQVAASYVDGLVDFCERLETMPERGNRHDDISSGLRTTNSGNSVIAFSVTTSTVYIIGVFHGGQDYETALRQK